jgi:hypothetical protein
MWGGSSAIKKRGTEGKQDKKKMNPFFCPTQNDFRPKIA